jgi:hypothetical protein
MGGRDPNTSAGRASCHYSECASRTKSCRCNTSSSRRNCSMWHDLFVLHTELGDANSKEMIYSYTHRSKSMDVFSYILLHIRNLSPTRSAHSHESSRNEEPETPMPVVGCDRSYKRCEDLRRHQKLPSLESKHAQVLVHDCRLSA